MQQNYPLRDTWAQEAFWCKSVMVSGVLYLPAGCQGVSISVSFLYEGAKLHTL